MRTPGVQAPGSNQPRLPSILDPQPGTNPKRRKNAAHGARTCGRTPDSYQGMPSGIPKFDEERARLWPLGLEGATVNGIFPESGRPWVATAKCSASAGRKTGSHTPEN